MFTYVKLKNFRSLVDLNVNLTNKKNQPKKLVLVYGENGVGKSNFATAFLSLYETLETMSTKYMMEKLRESLSEAKSDLGFLKNYMANRFRDLETIIKSSKTVGSQATMVLEFGFNLHGKKGFYRLETNECQIISERLEFVVNKNKTVFFDLTENSIKINDKIFRDTDYKNEIDDLINKFWGKHSLLSIFVYEIEEKKRGYVKSRICNNFYDLLMWLVNTSIRVKDGYGVEKGKMGISHDILGALAHGKIPTEETKELDKAEIFLNQFFTHMYADVKQVYYKREFSENKIEYHLMFKKLIYNQLLDIDFENESTGTQYLLEIIPFFMAGVEGRSAILDEMDTGIHDLLIDNILENLYDSIQGQIIITTHNTMLLESNLPKECIYIFNVDAEANKELLPLSSFEEHLHPNLNIRKRYLKGMYGGIPNSMEVDFGELMLMME